MSRHRLEVTLDERQLKALDEARGFEPRASYVKRWISALGSGQAAPSREPVMPTVQRPVSANARPVTQQAPAFDARAAALERQQRLNQGKYRG